MKGANIGMGTQGGSPILAAKGLLGSSYARSKKALMATINEIRSAGASVEVDLPTIVVAGNQSSGKSSLIETISGINLPRAAGTCTRVPMEVRLKQDDVEWKCVVRVRREGNPQDEVDGMPPEVTFGDPITDPSKVEAVIRRAQLGILNPSVALKKFVKYEIPKEPVERPRGSFKQFAFSKDVIVLEITGPNVTDLTLVDLPGIIQNVGQNEDKNNITLIEDMVKSYISKECLILLVITMTDDIQNQKAAQLARDADPEGKRIIGVLTKVDTLKGKTDPDRWMKVAQNKDPKATLLHGYYVSPCENMAYCLWSPANLIPMNSPKGSHSNVPGSWRKPSFATRLLGRIFRVQRRSGWVPRTSLRSSVISSRRLSRRSESIPEEPADTRLPDVETKIAARHEQLEEQIKNLGEEPSDDSIGSLLGLLTTFQASINKHVEGHTDHEAFVQDVNELAETFMNDIHKTKPVFMPSERSKASGDSAGDKKEVGKGDLSRIIEDAGAKLNLDDMKLHIKACRTWELPNQLPPSALNKLINRSTSTWERLALALLDDVRPVIKVLLDDLIQEVFGRYKFGGLPSSVNMIVNERLQAQMQTTRDAIKMVVELERRPYTQNSHYLEANHAKNLASLKERRGIGTHPSANPANKAYVDTVLANLSAMGQSGVKAEDLPKLQPPDEYETEMDLMAQTGAYWQVAYKRVIDNVPRVINLVFLKPLAGALRAALIHELKVSGDDARARCKDYLDEAPDVAEQRKDLTGRKERLGVAKVAIRKFKMK